MVGGLSAGFGTVVTVGAVVRNAGVDERRGRPACRLVAILANVTGC